MIVKNEAENLPRLFESIEGCFDEVHITDTGSTDDTVAIAERFGAKVHRFDWVQDFSAARNASFDPVTTDFVCWLDGDDTLDNPEGFKRFRDDVMALADYWVAPYHYASDANGKAVCTFARERVLRVNKQMRWNYAIHEGIKPESPLGPVKVQMAQGWAVRHRRTDADLQKDRSRNLGIFEEMLKKGPLDSRMHYYYGKELFEAGRIQQAIHVLGCAVTDSKLEHHDRVLGFQYLCFAFSQQGNFPKVMELAHQGQILEPQRAEFYTLVGDALLKMGRIADAAPQFQAAKACYLPSENQATAIFHHGETYTAYPRNQLARIYANLGDIGRAKAEAQECVDRFDHAEAKAILAELTRIEVVSSNFDNAEPCDDIVFTTAPQTAYEFDPELAKSKAMGGSETALMEMAHWLRKKSGRTVKVFAMRAEDKICDGVEYISNQKLNEYMSRHKPFLHIAWRHNIKVTNAPTFVWCHDLMTPGLENTAVFERALCLTPFHKRYAMATQALPEEKIWVTRNGVKPDRFTDGPWEKDPWKFVFSSSPDRGLDRTMRVLDRVREKYPQVKLHVYYGVEHLDRYGLGDLRVKLQQMMAERKDWVIYHGATQQDELMREFKSAAYCVQPSDWIETSMISAMERLACGVYQIMRAVGGCVDTLAEAHRAGMAALVESECISEVEHDLYAQKVIEAIESEAYKRVKIDPELYAWETVADEWLTGLPKLAYPEEVSRAAG